MKLKDGIGAQKSQLQADFSIHLVGKSQENFTRFGPLTFTDFFALFWDIYLINWMVDYIGMLIIFCVSVVFGKLQSDVNFLTDWIVDVKADDVFLFGVELENKILVLFLCKFLKMSNAGFKFDVGVFCWCDQSEMDEFGISSVEFFDNNNKLFGSDLGLFKG